MTSQYFESCLRDRNYSDKQVFSLLKTPYLDLYEDFTDFENSFVGTFVLKNPKNVSVARYVLEALSLERIEWSDFTATNLERIKNYVKSKVTSNSARTYFAMIKSVLGPRIEDGDVPCTKTRNILRSKIEPSEHIVLTADELERFWLFKDKLSDYGENYHDIWRSCCLQAYIGSRHSDISHISVNNIREGRDADGNTACYIQYVSQKSKIVGKPPLHPRFSELIRMPDSGREYDLSTVERVIRNICRIQGIDDECSLFAAGKRQHGPKWIFATSHLFRRTYATLMACGKKPVPIAEISRFMAHANIEMTMRYINNNYLPINTTAVDNLSV